MNSAKKCHEIDGAPNVYVDAFRGTYLSQTSKDPSASFILTHYHGDHYGNLPRDGAYQGPALIHCTVITARLLVKVHGISAEFVVEHEYGETFELPTAAKKGTPRLNQYQRLM